jgi:Fe-S-cluster containining protein
MDSPPVNLDKYSRGTLVYRKGSEQEEVEFYYPIDLEWDCTRCGACCQDSMSRERRVLLLESDIHRFQEVGFTDFHEKTLNDDPFVGVLRKNQGKCIFLGQGECKTYPNRALLCRMYPFWVEKNGESFIIQADLDCPGFGDGEKLCESFFSDLLSYALRSMKY